MSAVGQEAVEQSIMSRKVFVIVRWRRVCYSSSFFIQPSSQQSRRMVSVVGQEECINRRSGGVCQQSIKRRVFVRDREEYVNKHQELGVSGVPVDQKECISSRSRERIITIEWPVLLYL